MIQTNTYQSTLAKPLTFTGIGLHSGMNITMTLHPSGADTGLVFRRVDSDLPEGKRRLPVTPNSITDTKLCTKVSNDSGLSVSTIEHLFAALHALQIDNLLIDIDAAEVPIMDGSSDAFIKAITKTGTLALSAPRYAVEILKPIIVKDQGRITSLLPRQRMQKELFELSFEIDFDHDSIGRQFASFPLSTETFKSECSKARTFGFKRDIDALRAVGLAKGGTLENAILLDENGVINPEGLRYENEFVRHKILDSIGDLYVLGKTFIGRYHGYKAGHEMNNKILRALEKNPSHWRLVSLKSYLNSYNSTNWSIPAQEENEKFITVAASSSAL